MCGIVGYVGEQKAYPILIDGLKKLEYRGYDSAGVALLNDNKINIIKSVGRLIDLENKINGQIIEGKIGIGHTRWATHGRPSDINAHPHSSSTEEISVVHNGIIENYQALRKWLEKEGSSFCSETDTEVLPHLVRHFYEGDLLEAVNKATAKVEGSYAMVVISKENTDKLVCARKDSPLVIGKGKGECFIASDIPAILKYTRETYILDDDEVAVVTAGEVEIFNSNGGTPVEKELLQIEWDEVAAEKDGYPHFMLKEINEQPRAIRETLRGRLFPKDGTVTLPGLKMIPQDLTQMSKIYVVACGTAYHAGLVGKSLIEKLVRLPVEVDLASEFRYRDPLLDESTLVIVISQSGETADTLAALRLAKQAGCRVVAITNVVGSSVAREGNHIIFTHAGPEIAVASTKAYITQLIALYLFSINMANIRGTISKEYTAELVAGIDKLPGQIEELLQRTDEIKDIAEHIAKWESAFYIGRGLDHYVALEGALKLKEISYIHAEAYAAGELKHGTLALITEGIPVIALATQPAIYDKTLSNIKEVKARDAYVLALVFAGDDRMKTEVDRVFELPQCPPLLAPVLATVPLQLLSYYASVARGCDVDKPRNLAKSVTVE